jgi:urease beta subunit
MSRSLDDLAPGAIVPADGPIEVNPDLPSLAVWITNTGDVPVHLTAYFHVFEANPRLLFDRRKAFGMRPDVPVGGAVRIEPGETRVVDLVPFGGRRVVMGFNGLVNGPLDGVDVDALLQRAIALGFLHRPDDADTESERSR